MDKNELETIVRQNERKRKKRLVNSIRYQEEGKILRKREKLKILRKMFE